MGSTDLHPGFIVFSDDFGEHPSSCQHIFRHASDKYNVLWVNTIGMRLPRLTVEDLKKAWTKIKKMSQAFFKEPADVTCSVPFPVIQPPMLPFINYHWCRVINRQLVCLFVQRRARELSIDNPVLVITAPNASDYIGYFNEKKVVYYCVDEFAEWPGVQKELVERLEDDLIEKTDEFIATSGSIYDKLARSGKRVSMLTHGVDLEMFSRDASTSHHLLDDIPGPRVGYLGLFDKRSNLELLRETAQLMPDISFVITGNLETDVSSLRQLRNIYFTGSIPHEELPFMLKGWDVCMLPYKINKLTDALQPLKLKEYLATGKPIVSTPIREVRALKNMITIAGTAEEWKHGIMRCLKGISADEKRERDRFLEQETWEIKTKQFMEICLG